MSVKKEATARVVRQERLTADICDLVLRTALAESALPGQFVNLYCRDSARLLPRPISICDAGGGELRLVYRIVGKGTEELSTLRPGDAVRLIGCLGNGYDLNPAAGRHTVLIGGGLGIPPMLLLMRRLHALRAQGGEAAPLSLTAVLGYRDAGAIFLDQAFSAYGRVIFASDDGAKGHRGTVLDAIRAEGIDCGTVYACGPMPMLRAVAKDCEARREAGSKDIKCYVSLEERMACGIGTCLGCVVRTRHVDAHSRVNNARICTEGPVFDSEAIAWWVSGCRAAGSRGGGGCANAWMFNRSDDCRRELEKSAHERVGNLWQRAGVRGVF